jgi:flagellar biosynthesis/type III secretory pathway protein FliH
VEHTFLSEYLGLLDALLALRPKLINTYKEVLRELVLDIDLEKTVAFEYGMKKGKAEGKLEGKAEGKLEGKAEGKLEGKAEEVYLQALSFGKLLVESGYLVKEKWDQLNSELETLKMDLEKLTALRDTLFELTQKALLRK